MCWAWIAGVQTTLQQRHGNLLNGDCFQHGERGGVTRGLAEGHPDRFEPQGAKANV